MSPDGHVGDERPEEVDFKRSVDAEIYASSNDEEVKSHLALLNFIERLSDLLSPRRCGSSDGFDTRLSRAWQF